MVALHATSVGTPYLSLFARVKNFRRNQLDEELYVKRNLIRLELMRGTLFIVSTELAPMLFQATRLSKPQLLKVIQNWGIHIDEYRTLAKRLMDVLKDGEKTLQEIKKVLPREIVKSVSFKTGKQIYKATNVSIVLRVLARRGVVITEKIPGTLSITKGNRFALLKEKYPKLNLNSVGKDEAKAMLVKSYIKAFGPVMEKDITWWTGFRTTEIKKILASMERELFHVEINGFEGNYLMLKSDYEGLIKFKPSFEHLAMLLPFEDPYTKGYKVRNRLIKSSLEKKVYIGGGVQPTILLNGKIIGTWNRNIEEGRGPIKLNFFSHVKKNLEQKFIEKAKAIGKVMSNQEVNIEVAYTALEGFA
ncbi:MAG: winged helix DNA-binding domain-containing protein [Candidatus Bathyarchaeia archaeon]